MKYLIIGVILAQMVLNIILVNTLLHYRIYFIDLYATTNDILRAVDKLK